MPNLTHKTSAQTFKSGFWLFSLSLVLAGKLPLFSLCAQTSSSKLNSAMVLEEVIIAVKTKKTTVNQAPEVSRVLLPS